MSVISVGRVSFLLLSSIQVLVMLRDVALRVLVTLMVTPSASSVSLTVNSPVPETVQTFVFTGLPSAASSTRL